MRVLLNFYCSIVSQRTDSRSSTRHFVLQKVINKLIIMAARAPLFHILPFLLQLCRYSMFCDFFKYCVSNFACKSFTDVLLFFPKDIDDFKAVCVF